MNNLHPIAQAVQSQGRGKDTQLVHMTPNEVAGMQALAKAHGGSLSINPSTGLPEAGFLDSMLPTILGVGLAAATGGTSLALTPGMIGLGIGGLQYMRTGSLEKGLMAGLGAYGGAGMAGSLGLGAASAAAPTTAAAAPVNQAAAAANKGLATQGSGLGVTGTQTAATNNFLSNAGMTSVPQASVAPQALSAVPQTTTAMPTMMDKLGSGQFWKDNWKSAAAAAAPVAMDMMGQKGTTAPKDNEQFQYDYDPGRVSEADLAAQRAANPGGELTYFRPKYGPRRTVQVAQGGILGYADGGISDYEYDPVTKTYKKKASAPVGAVPSVGVPGSGGDSGTPVQLTKEQIDFFDNEDKSPGGARDQRMGKINDILSMIAPGGIARALVGGLNNVTGGGVGNTRAPVSVSSGTTGMTPNERSFIESGGYTTDVPSADQGGYDPTSGYDTDTDMAKGGLAGLAAGGMSKGGFVVPADVVSALGNGSSDAGLRKLYALIGDVKPIKGKGDGLSDSIPTSIDGRQPARVADGEAYVNPKTVAKIGGGDAKKGAKKLYAMMDKIRQQAHGKKTQQREVNAKAVV